jgi:hypothetical protein
MITHLIKLQTQTQGPPGYARPAYLNITHCGEGHSKTENTLVLCPKSDISAY